MAQIDLIIRAETSGATAEAAATLTVMPEGDPSQRQAASCYKLSKGWKLLVKAIHVEGDAATRVRVRVGTDSTTAANNPVVASRYLASPGQLDTDWREPLVVKATASDLYLWVTFQQPTAGYASATIVATQTEL